MMEDAGLGRLVSDLGIEMTPLPSLNVPSIEAVDSLTDEEILASFHFRTTSEVLSERRDIQVMRALHTRVVHLEIREGIRRA